MNHVGRGDFVVVSIRSPDRSQGRHGTVAAIDWNILFQSAPLTGARGDNDLYMSMREELSFNPLP